MCETDTVSWCGGHHIDGIAMNVFLNIFGLHGGNLNLLPDRRVAEVHNVQLNFVKHLHSTSATLYNTVKTSSNT